MSTSYSFYCCYKSYQVQSSQCDHDMCMRFAHYTQSNRFFLSTCGLCPTLVNYVIFVSQFPIQNFYHFYITCLFSFIIDTCTDKVPMRDFTVYLDAQSRHSIYCSHTYRVKADPVLNQISHLYPLHACLNSLVDFEQLVAGLYYDFSFNIYP